MSLILRQTRLVPLGLVIVLSFGAARTAEAQFGSIKDRIKQKAAEKVAKKVVEQLDDKSADSASKAPQSAEASATSTASTAPTSRKEWANYDFVPGARTIFFTDFTDDVAERRAEEVLANDNDQNRVDAA